MSQSWSSFHCSNPDFFVRSVPDGVTFPVNRTAMQTSEVFQDMFSCCDASATNDNDQSLDIYEPAGTLAALLCLLHSPLAPPTVKLSVDDLESLSSRSTKEYDPTTVVPLPILISLLFVLADKYVLANSTFEVLEKHLLANVSVDPLFVYGFATARGMESTASKASQYLMPLASYTSDEIKNIPSVGAYHKLVRLQDLRVKVLQNLVLAEDIFPHGYGACPAHTEETIAIWDRKRKALAPKVETVTDVSGEMATLIDSLPRDCHMCRKACIAAVKMLAYKCRKAPRQIDHLPAETL